MRQVPVVYGGVSSVSIAAEEAITLAAGTWYIKCGGNTVVEVHMGDAGWAIVISTTETGIVVSDGVNARLHNISTTTADTCYIRRVL